MGHAAHRVARATRSRGRSRGGWRRASGVSLAAQAATLPVVLVAFGRLAVLSPLVNLAIVPLVAPAMAVGLLAMAGGGLALAGAPTIVGAVLAMPGWIALRIMVAIVDATAALPFASVTLPPQVAAPLAVATVVGVGAIGLRPTRRPTAPRATPDARRTSPAPADRRDPCPFARIHLVGRAPGRRDPRWRAP